MNTDNLNLIHQVSPIAYLDGGSGSLIFQMVVAGCLTAGFAIKTRWQSLMTSVGKLRHRDTNVSDR